MTAIQERAIRTKAPARYVRLAKDVVEVGGLAGIHIPHPFAGDAWTGTSCLACFGAVDNPDHLQHRPLRRGGGTR